MIFRSWTRAVVLLAVCFFSVLSPLLAQVPLKQWDRTVGGPDADRLHALLQTREGDYLLGGTSLSARGSDKTELSRGSSDYWVVQLDAQGTPQWDRTLGGSGGEDLQAVLQTPDGGYLLGGASGSGRSGDKTQASRGESDYWLVKLDAQGTKQWDQGFGGPGIDVLTALQLTQDGGYLLGGYSASERGGDKTQAGWGSNDYWILKLDANGTKQWDRVYGGYGDDRLAALQQTQDGGYLLGGSSDSNRGGDETQPSQGQTDYWVLKLDASGTKQWDKTFGGYERDYLTTLQQTREGYYLLGGRNNSGLSGDRTQPGLGSTDFWVLLLNQDGTKRWDRAYGGRGTDYLQALQQTADGGYVAGGISDSPVSGDESQPNRGLSNYWMLKLDAQGNKQWDRTCGGNGYDQLHALQQTRDGGYILGGFADSAPYEDKSEASKGFFDYWVLKLGPAAPETVQITGDTVVCPTSPVVLTAVTSPPAVTYRWSTGATTPTLTVTQPGAYALQVTFPSGQMRTREYTVQQGATALRITGDSVVRPGTTVVLTASPSGASYTWSTGATTPTLTVAQAGTYSVLVRYANGCSSQATYHVRRAADWHLPNVLTPNHDRLNDVFVVPALPGEHYALEVYTRWGAQVYQSAHYQNSWGAQAAAGTYYYVVRQVGTGTLYKGWVQVIR